MRALLDASGTATSAAAPAAKYSAKLEAAARRALTEDDDESGGVGGGGGGPPLVAKGDAAAAQAACEKALAAYRPPAKTTPRRRADRAHEAAVFLARQASGLSKAGIVQPDAKQRRAGDAEARAGEHGVSAARGERIDADVYDSDCTIRRRGLL